MAQSPDYFDYLVGLGGHKCAGAQFKGIGLGLAGWFGRHVVFLVCCLVSFSSFKLLAGWFGRHVVFLVCFLVSFSSFKLLAGWFGRHVVFLVCFLMSFSSFKLLAGWRGVFVTPSQKDILFMAVCKILGKGLLKEKEGAKKNEQTRCKKRTKKKTLAYYLAACM